MNRWLEILIGLILVIVPIALIFPGMPMSSWGYAALVVLKGAITWVLILVGLLLIILGINDLR